jgi:DNA segregation ATPase FtsK/SpoIIIE, S-DNA-T family
MAVKKKNRNNSQKKPSPEGFFSVSPEKKKKVFGIFLVILSLFLLISIISFDRRDEALFNFSGNAEAYNLLGIVGVHVAYFLVKQTLGYFSLIIPAIIFTWSLLLFKKNIFKFVIHFSNFLLIGGVILASFFGVLQKSAGLFSGTYELYGNLGKYFGELLAGFLGGIGASIILLFALFTLLIFAFDIKIEKIFLFFKDLFTSGNAGIKINRQDEEVSNLEKIKKLRPDNKKKKLKGDLSEEPVLDTRTEEERIKIIRKDEEPAPTQLSNEIIKEESKKVDLAKTGEIKNKREDEGDENLPEPWDDSLQFNKIGLELLAPSPEENFKVAEAELKTNAQLLKEKLKLFDIDIQDISVTPGPVVTLYEIVPAPGVKISKIVGLENDIALALAAKGIRIIAPIPGKGAIGVEIPNTEASLVNARSVLSKIRESKYELPLAMGKTISGDVYITDLSQMPHLLIAGSTGSGKSVGINMIISSLLYTKHPSEVKFILVDPKKIELSFYNKLRKHFLAVSPDLDEDIITVPQNAVLMLKSVEIEMEKRYDKLAKAGVRNIVDYNKKVKNPKTKPHDSESMKHHPLPYLVVIIDELADLMITAGKEVEEPITRLAQLARAVGIHLVLATQRPSVNVITGVIKANFSSRVAYQVATKIDSRTILDMNGAEQLLGKGDMLFLPTGSPKPIRMQNAFISTDEVEKITNYVYSQLPYARPYFLPSIYDKKKSKGAGFLSDMDPMFEEAARTIVLHQQGSVSLLQRKLKLGYSRAARIVDQLEEAGIVGPNDGSKARQVLIENEEMLETVLRSL